MLVAESRDLFKTSVRIKIPRDQSPLHDGRLSLLAESEKPETRTDKQRSQLGEFNISRTPTLVRNILALDFAEKILTGQVTGEGVKRTPSYDTPLSRSELEKWRKEFWGMV